MEKKKEILKKLKSVSLFLMAHPDNISGSEFEDREEDIKEIILLINKIR